MRFTGNNPEVMRKRNLSIVKNMVFKYPGISRSEIAKYLSLTPASITSIVSEIMKTGIVEETNIPSKYKSSGRQRKGLSYSLNKKYCIGIEIGPYELVVVLCDLQGSIVASEVHTGTSFLYDELIEKISVFIKEVIRSKSLGFEHILSIGLGIPGKMDERKGIIVDAFTKDWNGKHITSRLQEEFTIPVFLCNNVKARALAVELCSTYESFDMFCYFFSLRGSSCPMVVRNFSNYVVNTTSGEMGHFKFTSESDKICPICGQHSCLDAIASNSVVKKEVLNQLRDHPNSKLSSFSIGSISMEDIFDACNSGENWILQIIKSAVKIQALALSNVLNLLSPDKVYIDSLMIERVGLRDFFLKEVNTLVFASNPGEIQFEFVDYDKFGGAKSSALVGFKRAFLNVQSV